MPRPAPQRRLLGAVPILALALAGCPGTTEPVPPNPFANASFDLQLFAAGDTAYVRDPVTGAAGPRVAPAGGLLVVQGTAFVGDTRRVRDGRLLVNAAAFDGRVARGSFRGIEYGGEMTPPADGRAVLRPPTLRDLAVDSIRLPAPPRVGASPPTLTADGLRLPLVPAEGGSAARYASTYWDLTLRRAGTVGSRTISGQAPLGAELVVPTASLPSGDGPIDAVLVYRTTYVSDGAVAPPTAGAWQYRVAVITRLRWTGVGRPVSAAAPPRTTGSAPR